MTRARVRFYADITSPYSYLGFELARKHYRAQWALKADVEFIPFFLGGVMKARFRTRTR
jgi:2-hydroxychromene-2-carboxylate isomerase